MLSLSTKRNKGEHKESPLWVTASLGAAILLILILPFLSAYRRFALTAHPGWNPVNVQVVGTRVVTAYATGAGQAHPATFFYRAEAEVQYSAKGAQFDVWLPASRTTSDRAELEMWLSDKKGRFATVFWNPKKPGEGEVKLHSDIGSHFAAFD